MVALLAVAEVTLATWAVLGTLVGLALGVAMEVAMIPIPRQEAPTCMQHPMGAAMLPMVTL